MTQSKIVCCGITSIAPAATSQNIIVDRITFGAAEYQWHPDGVHGHADPDGPPAKSKITGGNGTLYQLPKASIVVLRGSL
jgi:hypothetical protein